MSNNPLVPPFSTRLKNGIGHILGLGYDSAESSRYRKDLGWGRMQPLDEENLVGGDLTRQWIRLKGQDLQRNNPVVAGCTTRIETFFVGSGLLPRARTTDKGWNRASEDFWKDYSETCDIRKRSTLVDLQAIIVGSRPVVGGTYFELLEGGQIRPIECERIRDPSDVDKAKDFVDGVKYDRSSGVTLGYWVHDRDTNGGFSDTHSERFVPRENMLPVIRRGHRMDQGREIPDLSSVIPILSDIGELNTYVLNNAKARSQIIGFMKKLTGQAPNMQPRGSTVTTPTGKRDVWKTDFGQIMSLFPQEDVVFPSLNIPDSNQVPYLKFQMMLIASALNLPYEFFAFDFSALDFSRQKGVLLFVNQIRRNWQFWLNQNFNQRLWNWRIAKEMRVGGQLSPAPTNSLGVSEWRKVEWNSVDAELHIDEKDRTNNDILLHQLALQPLTEAARRRGRELEDVLNEKADILLMAHKIELEKGLPPNSLINAQIPGQAEAKGIADGESGREETK